MDKQNPFIVRFATKRPPASPLPGSYSTRQHVTMVKKNGEELPLIIAGSRLAELHTKTKADRESDDTEMGALRELATKTLVERERDDDYLSVIRELLTKTDAERERDD